MSVKNYNLAKNSSGKIHFLSGTSLIATLQEYPDFLNHYMNITADHPGRYSNTMLYTSAKNTLKLLLATKALEGGSISQGGAGKKADILIINNSGNTTSSAQGQYLVADINTIANNLARSLSILQHVSLGKPLDSSSFALDNVWQGENKVPYYGYAMARIRKIIQQMHSTKFDVQISVKELRKSQV